MRKLNVFNFISLDGYYKGTNEDIGWHTHGGEDEGEFSAKNAQSGGILLFGRVTYEMMYSFWPTPMARQNFPEVADGMNKAEKIVFSRTMKTADWHNTRVVNDNMVVEIIRLKDTGSKDLTILGSGSIVAHCAELGLIDSYQFMIDPVAIGSGTPIFKGLSHKLDLQLTSSRVFKSGAVLLCYEPR
jgi:dihydrofolate reductase